MDFLSGLDSWGILDAGTDIQRRGVKERIGCCGVFRIQPSGEYKRQRERRGFRPGQLPIKGGAVAARRCAGIWRRAVGKNSRRIRVAGFSPQQIPRFFKVYCFHVRKPERAAELRCLITMKLQKHFGMPARYRENLVRIRIHEEKNRGHAVRERPDQGVEPVGRHVAGTFTEQHEPGRVDWERRDTADIFFIRESAHLDLHRVRSGAAAPE